MDDTEEIEDNINRHTSHRKATIQREARSGSVMTTKQDSKQNPKPLSSLPWGTLIASVTAIGSLFTAYSAEKTQTIQNAPYLALGDVSTQVSTDPRPPGAPEVLYTAVTFRNNGTTQATHLSFTSIGWYASPTSETTNLPSGGFVVVRGQDIFQTIPWQRSAATATLDRDQPTLHRFEDFPLEQEPEGSVDYIYIEARFDDAFVFPFQASHLENFCIMHARPISPQVTSLPWTRVPLAKCAAEYIVLVKNHAGGPIDEGE